MKNPNVVRSLSGAFTAARTQFPLLHRKWIEISIKATKWLPNSIIMSSVQMIGDLDMIIRSIEDHVAPELELGIESEEYQSHFLNFFTNLWISTAYEVIRLINDRDKELNENFLYLYNMLTIVRIPLMKHEIARERKADGPMMLSRFPSNEDEHDIYEYSVNDSSRSVILPIAISRRGSVMWYTPDIINQKNIWIERRDLSDRFIAAFDSI